MVSSLLAPRLVLTSIGSIQKGKPHKLTSTGDRVYFSRLITSESGSPFSDLHPFYSQ